MREQMRRMQSIEQQLKHEPDGQLSLTDRDARSMATSGRGSGIVGYNVQVAVDAKHHLIVAHEVTNAGSDRAQLAPMAAAAREAMGKKKLQAVADRGYYSGPQIKACDDAGIAAILPKPMTSNAKAEGRLGVSEFLCSRRSETFPRRRSALATNRPTRWESRSSYYATVFVNRSA